MLWVEQPVGVGFTQGTPNITDEVELGLEFIGFYKNFIDAFQLHGAKTYLTGKRMEFTKRMIHLTSGR